MREKKTKNLGIRATEKRWLLLNEISLKRGGVGVQALVDEAIDQWLAANSQEAERPPKQVEAGVDLSGVPPDLSDLFMEMVEKIQSRPSRQALPFPRNYSQAKPRRPRVGGGK